MPLISFEELAATITVRTVLERTGWTPTTTETDGEQRGQCPIHVSSSKRPRSFCVSPDGLRWYCHRCKVGGDSLDLWKELYPGTGSYAAALEMCNVFDRRVPLRDRAGTEKRNG